MLQRELVDLGDIDPAVWRLFIRGNVYGPYTLGQVRSFAEEGRIGPHSKLAYGDQSSFLRAADYDGLRDIFSAGGSEAMEPSRLDQANDNQTDAIEALSNFLVIVQRASHLSEDTSHILEALNASGQFAEAMPGIYVLRTSDRIGAVRRQLNTVCGVGEQVVLVDATNDRLAWCNLTEDASEHLRSLWGTE